MCTTKTAPPALDLFADRGPNNEVRAKWQATDANLEWSFHISTGLAFITAYSLSVIVKLSPPVGGV